MRQFAVLHVHVQFGHQSPFWSRDLELNAAPVRYTKRQFAFFGLRLFVVEFSKGQHLPLPHAQSVNRNFVNRPIPDTLAQLLSRLWSRSTAV